jgi:hypothetical protein
MGSELKDISDPPNPRNLRYLIADLFHTRSRSCIMCIQYLLKIIHFLAHFNTEVHISFNAISVTLALGTACDNAT